jgi:hypothetical protein
LGRLEAGPLLNVISSAIEASIPSSSPRDISNTLWAPATAKIRVGPDQVGLFGDRFISPWSGRVNGQDIAITTWAISQFISQLPKQMMDPLASLLRNLTPMREDEVGMMFLSLLSSDVSEDVVDALLRCVQKAMRTFSPMSVASTLHFFATHRKSKALPKGTYLSLCQKLEDVSARPTVPYVSLSLWTLAKLPFSIPTETRSTLCRRTLMMLHDFLPMQVVRALWSLAELARARKCSHSVVNRTMSDERAVRPFTSSDS